MKGFLCTVAMFAATLGATFAADEITVINVEANEEGKLVFPKVKVGDIVRFRLSCQMVNGEIAVTTTAGAKVVREARGETAQGGKLLPTGTRNLEFEVKAEKKGKATISVAVKNGTETVKRDYDLEVEDKP